MSVSGSYDVVVIGGGLGAVAGALAAAKLGCSVILVNETQWIGGQVSSQCIPLDEHPWIENTGCTRSYREFRDRVRDFYRRNYPLKPRVSGNRRFNPGSGNIGPLTHEPHVAMLVLEEMLAPWISRGWIKVLRKQRVVAAEVQNDSIRSVVVRGLDGTDSEIYGTFFLDATDLGELIHASQAEHVIGAESNSETGELHALDGPPDPLDQQAITWAMVLSLDFEHDNTIERPATYDEWKAYVPPHWPGSLLSWEISDHVTHRTRSRPLFDGRADSEGSLHYDLWHARRILDASNFDAMGSDITVAAWPMMDYFRLPLLGVSDGTYEDALNGAKELSRSFLYWMQTEAPRHDGGSGYPELRPRGDLAGTEDGLAQMPYIRESRRIKAQFTLLEQHIGVEAREGLDGAEFFADSVGIAAYRIDIHPSTAGRPTIDLDTWPFQIPLRSLIPVRLRNLLPAAKNIGSTHITSGAYRVHPGEWTVGEAAGALVAYCRNEGLEPHHVTADPLKVEDFQKVLSINLGIELAWPRYEALRPQNRLGYVQETGES